MKIYTTCDVLIVDDDKIMCEILKTRLNNLNISCDISYDGFNVFDKLFVNKNVYKIILMDFEMKGLNGPATVKWIRNNKYWGILVGHTAHNVDDYIKEFYRAGIDEVFIKPLDFNRFMHFIEYTNQYYYINIAVDKLHNIKKFLNLQNLKTLKVSTCSDYIYSMINIYNTWLMSNKKILIKYKNNIILQKKNNTISNNIMRYHVEFIYFLNNKCINYKNFSILVNTMYYKIKFIKNNISYYNDNLIHLLYPLICNIHNII